MSEARAAVNTAVVVAANGTIVVVAADATVIVVGADAIVVVVPTFSVAAAGVGRSASGVTTWAMDMTTGLGLRMQQPRGLPSSVLPLLLFGDLRSPHLNAEKFPLPMR